MTNDLTGSRIVPWTGADPLYKETGVPVPLLHEIRAAAPIAELQPGEVFCTRYRDVADALRSTSEFPGSLLQQGSRITAEELTVIQMDEPRHSLIRRLFYAGVTQSRVAPYESSIRQGCDDAILWILDQDHPVDFIEHYIRWTPVTTIARIIGVPERDWALLDRWVDEISHSEWLTRNEGPQGHGIVEGFPEFSSYIFNLIDNAAAGADAATDGADDGFLTVLLKAEPEGRRLTKIEMLVIIAFMLEAGSDTTRHLLAHVVMHLAQHQDMLDLLHEDPESIPDFVEEMLRLYPPATTVYRTASQGAELAHCPIPVGTKTVLSVSAANRDPDVFGQPDEADLGRENLDDHLAFGFGRHVCPGAPLARLEARIATEVLVNRVSSITLDPTWRFEMVPVIWANGPRTLLATARPRESAKSAAES